MSQPLRSALGAVASPHAHGAELYAKLVEFSPYVVRRCTKFRRFGDSANQAEFLHAVHRSMYLAYVELGGKDDPAFDLNPETNAAFFQTIKTYLRTSEQGRESLQCDTRRMMTPRHVQPDPEQWDAWRQGVPREGGGEDEPLALRHLSAKTRVRVAASLSRVDYVPQQRALEVEELTAVWAVLRDGLPEREFFIIEQHFRYERDAAEIARALCQLPPFAQAPVTRVHAMVRKVLSRAPAKLERLLVAHSAHWATAVAS